MCALKLNPVATRLYHQDTTGKEFWLSAEFLKQFHNTKKSWNKKKQKNYQQYGKI